MCKLKLILVVADERISGEYDNVVNSISEAKERAKKMLEEVDDEHFWDVYVEVYDLDEWINLPEDDYICFGYDTDGVFCEWLMRMGAYARLERKLIGRA